MLRFTEEELKEYQKRQKQCVKHIKKPDAITTIKKEEKCPHEDIEQLAVVRWLDMKGITFFAVPNGGLRNIIIAKKLKAQGVRPGVPDIIVVDNPPKYPYSQGVAIEMKRIKGGVVSIEQKDWLEKLENRGWFCKVAKGSIEAINFMESLGY